MMALAFAHLTFAARASCFLGLVTRMYPPMTTVIPVYLMLRTLGLVDTLVALVIVFTGLQIPLVLWIMHASLSRIPRDIVESAALDGASFPRIVGAILLPRPPRPGVGGILSFIFCWNDFLLPFVITSADARTGTVAIMAYTETYKSVLWGPLSTVSIAMIAPTALFMLALRTYLVKGLTTGMLKGELARRGLCPPSTGPAAEPRPSPSGRRLRALPPPRSGSRMWPEWACLEVA